MSRLATEMWPGVPVQAAMSAGYTDNRWLRNAGIPAYGVSGLFSDQGRNGVHGRNERVAVKECLRQQGIPLPAGEARWPDRSSDYPVWRI